VRGLGLDPLDGQLYVMLNRRRFMAALLWYDGSGWCVLKKRLSKGTFQLPEVPSEACSMRIDAAALTALLQGVDLRARRRRWFRRSQVPGP
jgi:transposase